MLAELVQIGKILAIVAQAGIAIFALTHDYKKDGKLTTSGRAAIVGICIATLFGVLMFWAEATLKRDAERRELAKISEQQAIQNELLSKQSETLRATQRSLFPIKKIRLSLALVFPPTSAAYAEACEPWSTGINPITNKVDTHKSIDWTEQNARQSILYLRHSEGFLTIASEGAEHPRLRASVPFASLGEKHANRIVDSICVKDKAVIVNIAFDETKVLENSGISSILDLQGKLVSVDLTVRSASLLNYGHLLSYTVNFSQDKSDESALLNAGPLHYQWTDDQLLAISSDQGSDQTVKRTRELSLKQWGPGRMRHVTWTATARADRNTMKMLRWFDGR
jgi:hypothetical protein